MELKRKRFLSFALAICLVICLIPVSPASAVTMTGGEVLYLKPNSNWTQANARFAAYFFGTGEAWASMTDINGDGIYAVVVPEGSWTNVIFCRMNPSSATNSWSNKWNQSSDLTFDGSKNLYTLGSSAWDKGSGSWSTYQETYTIAGSDALCGTSWDTANTANDLVLAKGGYTKTYTAVEAGTYEFKVVANHAWTLAWPSSNYSLALTEKSNVTITFNPVTGAISVSKTAWVCPHANTTTTTKNPTCGKSGTETVTYDDCGEQISSTTLPATGAHNYVHGVCSVCGANDPEYTGVAKIGDTRFATFAEALAAAKTGDTIQLLTNIEASSLILKSSISLDLNGNTFTAAHMTAYSGSKVIDSTGGGLLEIARGKLMLQEDNGYLPIWSEEAGGYVLRDCKNLHYAGKILENSVLYQFLPAIGTDSYKLLTAGSQISGVTMKVVVSWDKGNGITNSSAFTYSDELIQAFYNSYDAVENVFNKAFSLELFGVEDLELTFDVYFESDTGVLLHCTAAAE